MSTDDEIQPGTRIRDWEVLEPIGRGGTTTVYRARRGDEFAALKICHSVEGGARERFVIGARTARALTKDGTPGVVPTLEVGEWNGQPYAVEELLEHSLVEDGVGPDPESAERPTKRRVAWIVDLGIQLADRLAALHESGVLHRDVKPDNILLRADGEPVLTASISRRTSFATR